MLCNGNNYNIYFFFVNMENIKNYQNDDNKFHTFRVHREVIHTKLLHLLNHAIYVYQGSKLYPFFAFNGNEYTRNFPHSNSGSKKTFLQHDGLEFSMYSNEFFVFTKKMFEL